MGVKGFQLWLRVEASLLASHFEGLNFAESQVRSGRFWYPDLGMLFDLKKRCSYTLSSHELGPSVRWAAKPLESSCFAWRKLLRRTGTEVSS